MSVKTSDLTDYTSTAGCNKFSYEIIHFSKYNRNSYIHIRGILIVCAYRLSELFLYEYV